MTNVTPRRIYLTAFAYAFVVALIVSGLIALSWYAGIQRGRQRVETRFAICREIEIVKKVERADKTTEIAASEKFLREHPRGIPGIPPELIQEGIDRKKATLRELAPNDCRDFANSGRTD